MTRAEANVNAIHDAISDRRFGVSGVADFLDQLDIDRLIGLCGEPRRFTRYVAPADGYRYWRQGDGRPALASDDIAVQQAIGRCCYARVGLKLGSLYDPKAHPAACGWCQYPDDELWAVVEWAMFTGRYVTVDLLVWDGVKKSAYVRSGDAEGYQNPQHAAFWALDPYVRERHIEAAAGRP